MYENGLFLFHRDLRIHDNLGLLQATRECKHIYTTFIFTTDQVGRSNKYKSKNSIQFMIESLASLEKNIHDNGGELILLYGDNTKMITQLLNKLHIDCLYFNQDYTPYAIQRDQQIMDICKKLGVQCKMHDDYYLQPPGTINNGQGEVYHKYTPFYQEMLKHKIDMPHRKFTKPLNKPADDVKKIFEHRITLNNAYENLVGKGNAQILVNGGRENGIARLHTALNEQSHYETTRDVMAHDTSLLSAYIKFGCISIREVFHTFRKKYDIHHGIIRQLIWRDFFAHILFRYPETLGKMYSPHFDKIQWKTNQNWLQLWKDGNTGFPLVDACMRQLNTTGYMHNRGRMLVASFLVKTLLIDWREGERYFAQNLIDYDVASNSGNWQSIVGGGAYSMPYFRIMNPWIQSAKFDRETIYIKRWVPELNDVPSKNIHQWDISCKLPQFKSIQYNCPIVNYSEQKEKALALYKKYL